MHLQITDDICAPPAIAATEEPELKHTATTWMSNGIDLIELDSDESGEEGFVGIVDDAATLYDVRLFFEKALGCPANVVRVRTVVGVENASIVCRLGVDGEEVIEIIGLGGRVWDFDDCELVVLSC